MEYKTISALTSKISPGSKLQISGPVQVVNHILLLESKHILILGGEVEDLLIVNAYENVLLRAIGKPITNEPIRDYKEEASQLDTNRLDQKSMITPRPMQPSYQDQNELLNGINFDDDDEIDLEMIERIENENRNNTNHNPVEAMIIDDDDGFLAEIDLDDIERASQRPQETTFPMPMNGESNFLTPPVEIVPDEDDVLSVNLSLSPSYSPIPTQPARRNIPKVPTYSEEDYKFKSPEGFNMVTVDQYLALSAVAKTKQHYVVQAKISGIAKKSLKITSNQWNLSGTITDAYSNQSIDVKFSNKVLESLSGHTAQEVQNMKSDLPMRPQLGAEIMKASQLKCHKK